MKTSKERTKQYFNTTAKDYDNSHDGKFVRCMYPRIADWVQEVAADRILDLGCGNGNVIAFIRKRKQAEYYGLDLSEKMIAEAEKRLENGVSLTVGDAEHLPYEDQFFDLVICNASFHHYPNPVQALEEIKRVLKHGGALLLGDPTTPLRGITNLLNWFMRYSQAGDYKIWHKKEIISLLEGHGFQVQKWDAVNWKSFLLQAARIEQSGQAPFSPPPQP